MKKLTFLFGRLAPQPAMLLLRQGRRQQGFIPMMLAIIGVIALIIFLIYSRVASVNH